MRVKEKSEKSGLKLNIQKLRHWYTPKSMNHAGCPQQPMGGIMVLISELNEWNHAKCLEFYLARGTASGRVGSYCSTAAIHPHLS